MVFHCAAFTDYFNGCFMSKCDSRVSLIQLKMSLIQYKSSNNQLPIEALTVNIVLRKSIMLRAWYIQR